MEIESSDAEQKKIEAATARDSSRIDATMHSALKRLGEELARERQTLHSRKVSLSKAEDDEKSSIQTSCTGRVNALRNEIAAASAQLKAELAAELKKHQDAHLMSSLTRYRISDADISGVGEKLTVRLQRAGIYTAADATHYRVMSVDGIGHQKGATIKRWRDGLVHRVQGNLPNQLDRSTEAQVRAKFASATTAKEGQVRALEQQRDAQLGAVAAKFKVQKDPVDTALKALDAENTKKRNEARATAEKERSMSRTVAITATKAINERLERAQHEVRRTEGEAGRLGYQLGLNNKKLSAYSQIRFAKWLWSQTKLVINWQ
jgi:predicted flap endonuclease-1-like 5' DNA nuclease